MNRLNKASNPLKLIGVISAIFAVGGATPARAVNLGVQGTTWPIIEIDMRALLMQQLASTNLKGIQTQLKHSVKSYFNDLPKRAAPGVTNTVTRWYNPSFTLQNDIWAPKQNSKGQWHWGILYRKGTTVNPLNYEKPTNAMLFFNGHSKQQIAFVKKAIEKFPAKLMLIEATGMNPVHLADKLHVPVYTETPEMTERFNLDKTPSLLYPGSGNHRLYLGFTTFAPPFSVKVLQETWPQGFGTHTEK